MRERYASEVAKEEIGEVFQELLDELAKEHEKPSTDFYDKKAREGHEVGMLVAGQKVMEAAKRLEIEGLRISESLQDHVAPLSPFTLCAKCNLPLTYMHNCDNAQEG